jgi:hypothetical protein
VPECPHMRGTCDYMLPARRPRGCLSRAPSALSRSAVAHRGLLTSAAVARHAMQGFLAVVSAVFVPASPAPSPCSAAFVPQFAKDGTRRGDQKWQQCCPHGSLLQSAPRLRHAQRAVLGVNVLVMRVWGDRASPGGWSDEPWDGRSRDGAQSRTSPGSNAAGLPEVQLNSDRWDRDSYRDRRDSRDTREASRGSDPKQYHQHGHGGGGQPQSPGPASGRSWFQENDAGAGRGEFSRENSARENIANLMAADSAGFGGRGASSPDASTQGGSGQGQVLEGAQSTGSAIAQQEPGNQMMMLVPIKMMVFVDGTWLYYSLFSRGRMRCPIIKQVRNARQKKPLSPINEPYQTCTRAPQLHALPDRRSGRGWASSLTPKPDPSTYANPNPIPSTYLNPNPNPSTYPNPNPNSNP